ncbi:ubiquitin carboxyl-terminal hydrolase 8 [Pelomyxa schiedti]|nr:ubiquitin carboxyl-terminal hydrolase 8 [Pelomyxa schiedti]
MDSTAFALCWLGFAAICMLFFWVFVKSGTKRRRTASSQLLQPKPLPVARAEEPGSLFTSDAPRSTQSTNRTTKRETNKTVSSGGSPKSKHEPLHTNTISDPQSTIQLEAVVVHRPATNEVLSPSEIITGLKEVPSEHSVIEVQCCDKQAPQQSTTLIGPLSCADVRATEVGSVQPPTPPQQSAPTAQHHAIKICINEDTDIRSLSPPPLHKQPEVQQSSHLCPSALPSHCTDDLRSIKQPDAKQILHRPYTPKGLQNLGNTCYMNSTLQCLLVTSPLVDFFTSGALEKEMKRKKRSSSARRLTRSFMEVIQAFHSASRVISPVNLKSQIAQVANQFSGTQQQDSFECLVLLLDALHQELNGICTTTPRPLEIPRDAASSLAFEAWNEHLGSNSSIIVDLFHGLTLEKMDCTESCCGWNTSSYSPMAFLDIPIPDRSRTVPLEDCLSDFSRPETIGCPQCGKQSLQKMSIVILLPPIVIIHLQRFDHTSAKIRTPVSVPLHTNFSCLSSGTFSYRLYALSEHQGSQLSSGHYTAHVIKDGVHWSISDTIVTQMSGTFSTGVTTSNALVLFYTRLEAD